MTLKKEIVLEPDLGNEKPTEEKPPEEKPAEGTSSTDGGENPK